MSEAAEVAGLPPGTGSFIHHLSLVVSLAAAAVPESAQDPTIPPQAASPPQEAPTAPAVQTPIRQTPPAGPQSVLLLHPVPTGAGPTQGPVAPGQSASALQGTDSPPGLREVHAPMTRHG